MNHDGPTRHAVQRAPRGLVRAVLRKAAVSLPVGVALALAPLVAGLPSARNLLMISAPRNPHEAYAHELAFRGLTRDPAAMAWVEAMEAAMAEPERVAVPFAGGGMVGADAPGARAFAFTLTGGRRLSLDAGLVTDGGRRAFVDIYRVAAGRLERIGGALPGATHTGTLQFEVLETTDFVVRLQPEAAAAASYTLAVSALPLLHFPVEGLNTRAIQSGFGAERDGGAREHRGVDIYARRGHPVVAAVDGWIMRVEETPVGGKVVWQQPLLGSMRLYYAHLDEQLVEVGQFVRAGELLGRVGNTGNARTTPPHLHFGVYLRRGAGRGGAVDPYPLLK